MLRQLAANKSFVLTYVSRLTEPKSKHANDIFISGFSDQVLRFIAERGSGAQLTHVEHIDVAYSLKAVSKAAVAVAQASHAGMLSDKPEVGIILSIDYGSTNPSKH